MPSFQRLQAGKVSLIYGEPLPLWPLRIDDAEKETQTKTRNRRSLIRSRKRLSLSLSTKKSYFLNQAITGGR